MKKISLILAAAVMVLTVQSARSQSSDTTKNHIEIKKKVKVGAHGRQVTKIKMEGKGTPGAITDAASGAVTGKIPQKVTAKPVSPTVVVVKPEPASKPAPSTTIVTTTAPVKHAPVITTHTTTTTTTTAHTVHAVHTAHAKTSKPVYHKTYKRKPVAASSTKTTTTTTVKKVDQ